MVNMKNDVIRIGSDTFVNKTELDKNVAFNLLFRNHEFIYIHNYFPWKLVNESWTGALGHINDIQWVGSN
jgi:hypothetical protein